MTTEKIKNSIDSNLENSEDTASSEDSSNTLDSDSTVSSAIESEKQEKSEITDPIKNLEEELESAKEEAKQSYDRFLRVSAEFDNFKKRTNREMEEFRKFANQSFAESLLSVVDNLERAIGSSKNDKASDACLVDGIGLTLQELLKVFEKYGIKPIESIGQPFDPVFHQAVMQEETDEQAENTVINELQKGYLIHDRLLRPSMVVVAMSTKQTNNQKNDTENIKSNNE